MAADNSSSKLYLYENLTQTPIISSDKLINIPGHDTLQRRLEQVGITNPVTKSYDNKIKVDNAFDVVQYTISVLTHILSMDNDLAMRTMRNCLMAYRFFASGMQWAQALNTVFPVCDNISYIHRYIWVYWIKHYYWTDIADDNELSTYMAPIINRLTSIPTDKPNAYNIQRSSLASYSIIYYSAYDYMTTGQQLTYYIHTIFCRMTPNEFTNNGWAKSNTSPNIKHAINHANIFCNAVVQDIIAGPASDKYKYYFDLLQYLLQLNNYYTSYCLCMALQQTHIEQIPGIRNSLSRIEQAEYKYICSLFDLVGNYDLYRKTIRHLTSEKYIPALPIHLKDITFLSLSGHKGGLKTWIKIGQILRTILTPYEHDLSPRPTFQSMIDTQPIMSYEELKMMSKD